MTTTGILLRSLAVGGLLASLAVVLPARGAEQPMLRAMVTVDGPLVTLGHLVDGAGDHAETAVFRAPDPGTTGTVSASRVLSAAAKRGLAAEGGHLDTVTVTRTSRPITADRLGSLVRERLTADGRGSGDAEIEIRLEGFEESLHIESAPVAPLELRAFDHDRASGRFTATVVVADSRIAAPGLRISGRAIEMVEVPVPARAIARGESITQGDLLVERVPRHQLQPGALVGLDQAVGQAARRGLRAGVPVTADMLMEPILVSRNDVVTIVYRAPGLTLTSRGRALAAGSRGDLVSVINSQSNRTLEAEVVGPGVVAVATVSAADALLGAAN